MSFSTDRPPYRVALFLAFLVTLVLDQGSKLWAAFHASLVINTGISFGLFSGPLVTIALLIGFVALFEYSCPRWHQPYPIASGLLLGGALSNIVDRIVVGGVRDWLIIPYTGLSNNLADYAIIIALVWIAFQEFRRV